MSTRSAGRTARAGRSRPCRRGGTAGADRAGRTPAPTGRAVGRAEPAERKTGDPDGERRLHFRRDQTGVDRLVVRVEPLDPAARDRLLARPKRDAAVTDRVSVRPD